MTTILDRKGALRPFPPQVPLSPEVRAVLADWKASSDFDLALAEVIADDPDLSTR